MAEPIVSKFNSALVSIPQELTVAAANFNLDFSLMKVEAPKEFLGVGDALSTRRRDQAEEGQIHVTARKLGALFEALAPSVPHLFKAYGTRASAISRRTKAESHQGFDAGIFAPQVGPDGTSIWAAATSGPGAIAIHLLACILARIFKTAEAISVWAELVERRKQQINESSMETIPTAMASKQTFSRQQLASWDASARSWLRTADADRKVQQTQLMLIVSNVRLPVNSKTDTYESVLEAWKSSMIAMDRLVQGIPQQVQEGAILLAMSSWHLYPDMEVLLEEVKNIKQNDGLMNGALLTIPAYGAVDNKEGVFWSLPLARMRYYSTPVMVERQIASTTSRVTICEFWIIVLGVILSQWEEACPSIERGCALIIRLSTLVNQPKATIKWLKYLADAAQMLTDSSDVDHLQSRKLLRLGMRWCSALLNIPEIKPPSFFGLQEFPVLLETIPTVEDRISILREIAATLNAKPQELLIRYPRRDPYAGFPHIFATALPSESGHSGSFDEVGESLAKRVCYGVSGSHIRWLVTTSLSEEERYYDPDKSSSSDYQCSTRRESLPELNLLPIEARLISTPEVNPSLSNTADYGVNENPTKRPQCPFTDIMPKNATCNGHTCSCVSRGDAECECAEMGVLCTMSCHMDKDGLLMCNSSRDILRRLGKREGGNKKKKKDLKRFQECPKGSKCARCHLLPLSREIEETGERWAVVQSAEVTRIDDWSFKFEPPQNDDESAFGILIGDVSDTAIFATVGANIKRDFPSAYGSRANIDEIERFLSSPSLDIQSLQLHLGSWWGKCSIGAGSQQQKCSLQALTFATDLYDTLEGTTISIETAQKPIYEALWAQMVYEKTKGSKTLQVQDQLAASFACLAMFETGEFNIDPKLLRGVLALSYGDSIYVRSEMISDPHGEISDRQIRRVFGNLGRSEMAFLLPPSEPKLGGFDINSWHMINHIPFDGQMGDKFKGTSLHLSFTDFELPVDVGSRGLRDTLVILLESVVSAYDRGNHIGDLDINAITRGDTLVMAPECTHKVVKVDVADQTKEAREGGQKEGLIAIDTWTEFFDLPETTAIFRATGNWQARLAAAAATLQQGNRAIILPRQPCLKCLEAVDASNADLIIA